VITLGVIRVVTSDDTRFVETHGRQIERAFPGVRTISICLPDQPQGVHDPESEALAASKLPAAARELASQGADAIVVNCCSDPGVADAASEVPIPVVGAGKAAALVSLAYGLPVGVISLTEEPPEVMRQLLGPSLVASTVPSQVRTTLDLLQPGAVSACVESARHLLGQGARVICLGCTGTATIGLPHRLAADLQVPVVDPVLAAGGFALILAAQRR